jgi:beta-glucosidase
MIQVYASRQHSTVERPVKWLVGFAKAETEPGGEVATDIPVPLRRLTHWDTADVTWVVEPGEYQLAIGRSSRDLPLRTTVIVSPGTGIP